MTFAPKPGDVVVHHLKICMALAAIHPNPKHGERSPFDTPATTCAIISASSRRRRSAQATCTMATHSTSNPRDIQSFG